MVFMCENKDLNILEKALNYEFRDKLLLEKALRHSSFVNEQIDDKLEDNERLEFLGDAVLNLIIGHLLMKLFPEVNEGELSRMRSNLVNENQLAEIARSISIGDFLGGLLEELNGFLSEGIYTIYGEDTILVKILWDGAVAGLFGALGGVLVYVVPFFLIIELLQDSGYLPRAAFLLDRFMHFIGVHGKTIIPMILGLGCNVPGILATRILESKYQRFIASTLISIAVPCAALQAMIFGIVGERGAWAVILIYSVLLITWLVIGFILKLTTKKCQPELLIEVPPYRIPAWSAMGTKMWSRLLGFIKEALPLVMGTVLIVNVLFYKTI